MEISRASPTGLTERQHYWLEHITRCDAGGNSTKEYAVAHDLSVQAMYSARKDLVERGALLPGDRGVRAASHSLFPSFFEGNPLIMNFQNFTFLVHDGNS